jgi:hypothetical protein
VKICSLYGVGFYYIPGTDICLKVGGWARYEQAYGYNGSMTTEFFDHNVQNRTTNMDDWRVKGTATFDARSPTEYGTVRSYIALGMSTNNVGDNPVAGGSTQSYNNRWFIQWAGFTIGHSTSFFDFYSVGANQYGFVTPSSDSGDGGWDVFAYTAQFGNGLSASLSAEMARRTRIINAGSMTTIAGFTPLGTNVPVSGADNYSGLQAPDLVANLRIDQAWGSAQIMGALHEVQAMYYGTDQTTGHPGDKLGFAVGAGIKLNAPMIGHGDYFQAEVDYTEGASRYSNMTAQPWDFSIYSGDQVAFGYNTDATYGGTLAFGASDLELTTTWAVNAAYTHFWNPAWKTTLWGSYYQQSYNDQANAMICDAGAGVNFGSNAIAIPGCNMDWNAWGGGLRTEWAVSNSFSMGLEVLYAKLDSATTPFGTVGLAPGSGMPTSTGILGIPLLPVTNGYTISDTDVWAVRFRATRTFYP